MSEEPQKPLKLWRVEIERTLYVLAADEPEAERIGVSSERDAGGTGEPDSVYARPAVLLAAIDKGWHDCLPYRPHGCKDERTIAEILAAPKA